MVTREKLYTAEEFFELIQEPEYAERRLELENGIIVEVAGSSPVNSGTAIRLAYLMGKHVYENDLGHMTGADGGYELSPNTVRIPDLAFVTKERYPELPRKLKGGPDIAIEMVSESEDILRKATEYLNAGTSLVWAIYPDKKTVHVLQKAEPRWQELGIDDTLTGGDVLPNLSIPIKQIFDKKR